MEGGIITVRLPPALRQELINQAHAERKSLNQMCVERLLPGIVKIGADKKVAWKFNGVEYLQSAVESKQTT